MAKISTKLSKSTSVIGPKMNQDEVYLDVNRAQLLVTTLERGYDRAIAEMDAISDEIKKAVNDKILSDAYAEEMLAWRNKINKQIIYTKNKKKNLINQFREDTRDFQITTLTTALNELTAVVSKLDSNIEANINSSYGNNTTNTL